MSLFYLLLVFSIFFQSFPALASNDLHTLFDQALLSSKNGELIKALDLWNEVIEISPNDAVAISNRGNVLLALGDAEAAISAQTRAIELLPSEPDPHLNRGIAEEFLKKWEDAKKDYEWILERFPENESAIYNLGNVFLSQGDWIEARVFFAKASLINPGFAMARSSKALIDYQLGELEMAEFELRNLIRKYPMMADARAALSALLWEKGFIGEAESNWISAVALDNRYQDKDWLITIRRWPPQPIQDLMNFLSLTR